ncbi:MAG: hypothetical protein IPF66_24555 [Holophagales bacterium]|nr:hypothetical protein [Holophagales bacterium]
MKPAAKPQYASVELPFGCAPPRPHCPICGHALLIVGEASIANVDACRHLAFVFIGEIAEFGFRSTDFQKRAAGRRTSQLDLSKLRKFLERIGYGNKLLALEITYGGMACGPVWYSDVYGLDYETIGDEVAELETPASVVVASAADR